MNCNFTCRSGRLGVLIVCALMMAGRGQAEKQFTASWESLKAKDDAPEWLKDAKFGIYTHWGPQTYFGDLPLRYSIAYYNYIYKAGTEEQKYHMKHYGDPAKVGYKDVIDEFKAKDFDPDVWADTFYDAGARFAGMVVIHHDNVAMWDSQVNPYNMMRLGPKRDITGELAKAYRAKDMKFLATFHSLGSWGHSFIDSYKYDGKTAPELYNEPHESDEKCSREFLQRNIDQIKEVLDKYRPDGIWFDYGLYHSLEDQDRLDIISAYYNWGEESNQDVVLIHKHGNKIPTGILDTERGRGPDLREKTWMNDESIGVSYWYLNRERKQSFGSFSGKYLTHVIIDLASKNGTFLLNVAPDKHGVIPDDQKAILNDIGGWLKKYGEAIYCTRPWEAYGEGPLQVRFPGRLSGSNPAQQEYGTDDIRFTRSKDEKTVYAIFMGTPKNGIPIQSMQVVEPELLKQCKWIGHGSVTVSVDKDGHPLVDVTSIQGDASKDFAYAVSFPAEAIEYAPPKEKQLKVVDLSVDTAAIVGDSINLVTIDADDGIRALRPWTTHTDRISWDVEVPVAGTWVVEGTLTGIWNSKLKVTFGDTTKTAKIEIRRPQKNKIISRDLGAFTIDKPGTYKLELQGEKIKDSWFPVEIYGMKLKQLK